MTSPKPPKKHARSDRGEPLEDENEVSIAEIVAEDIEAGYDIQSDAAVRPLVDDPASSSDSENV